MLDYILGPSLLYLVAAVAINATVPAVPVWVWLVGFIVNNTVVNCLGIRMTAAVTWVMLVGGLLVLAVFIGFGVWAVASGRGHFIWDPLSNPHTFTWLLVFRALSIAVLSFLGFDGMSMLAEESRGAPDGGVGDGRRAGPGRVGFRCPDPGGRDARVPPGRSDRVR